MFQGQETCSREAKEFLNHDFFWVGENPHIKTHDPLKTKIYESTKFLDEQFVVDG